MNVTNGPWILKSWHEPHVVTRDYQAVATVHDPVARNLIKAAPDLLAALRECITEDGASCLKVNMSAATHLRRRIAAINEIARIAIAKAEG